MLDKFPNLTVIERISADTTPGKIPENICWTKIFTLTPRVRFFRLDAEEAAQMIRDHGYQKMLFGTDYPMWDHEEELARFFALPL